MQTLATATATKTSEKSNPNKGNGRKMMMPWHIGRIPMSSNAFRTIIHIVSAYGSDGKIVFKRKTLSELCQLSLKQLDSVIIELKNIGLIETKRTGRSLRFYLADIFWQDQISLKVIESPATENDTVSSPTGELRVTPQGNSPIKDEKNILKEKKKQQSPLKPADERPPDVQPTAGPFFKSETTKKLGDFSESIARSCADIVKMPSKKDFNPQIFIYKALKDNIHPKVIDESLSFVKTFKSLDEIDPYAVVRNRSKLKTQKYNARDAEIESDKRKFESIENGKIVFVMKGI